MSIWKTAMGAIIGGIAGGPIGAVVGGYAGYNADKIKSALFDEGEENEEDRNLEQYLDVISNTFEIFVLGAKIDGVINKEELKEISASYKYFIENIEIEEIKKEIKNRLVEALEDEDIENIDDMDIPCTVLRDTDKEYRVIIFQQVVNICLSDGDLNNNELEFLHTLQEELEITDDELGLGDTGEDAEAGNDLNSKNQELINACKFLGCDTDITLEELKKVYRNKISQFHPDRIQGKDLPQEFIDFANEQAKKINGCYFVIKNHIESGNR